MIKQLLESGSENFSEKAIISIIHGQKNLEALKIAEGFMRSFSISSSQPGSLDVSALFTRMWTAEPSIKLQTVIAVTALIEELSPTGEAAVEASLRLLANICLKCP